MRLVLPVMYCKEESLYKMNNNVPLEPSDFVVHHAIFYSIDTIESVKSNPNECIVLNASGEYRIPLSMKEVDKKIMHQRKSLFYAGN